MQVYKFYKFLKTLNIYAPFISIRKIDYYYLSNS